jgi:hypothetical protein
MLRYLQIQVIVIMMNARNMKSIDRTAVLKISKLGLEIHPKSPTVACYITQLHERGT